jgi:hypothetical protein
MKVGSVLKREQEEKARVKPLPKLRKREPQREEPAMPVPGLNAEQPEPISSEKDILIAKLDAELAQMKRDRGKLATRTAWLVAELEQQLRAKSPAMAREFMDGNLPMKELEEHYAAIEAHTDKGAVIHEQREYVERYGVLPDVTPVALQVKKESLDISGLKYQIRRLDDLIYKKNKNLQKVNTGIKTPKNNGRPAQWREELALAEAQREGLKQQLKRKQNEQRSERPGGE